MLIKPSQQLIEKMTLKGYLHDNARSVFTSPSSLLELFYHSWDCLPLDQYLGNEAHFRYRRYSVFEYRGASFIKCPVEPHYQMKQYNSVYGGLYRYYEDINDSKNTRVIMKGLVQWVLAMVKGSQDHWKVECHQFRICASLDEEGKPTPEGIHQDGADYVLIMLMDKKNVRGGGSRIYSDGGQEVYATNLEKYELLLLDDKRYWHGVENILPEDGSELASRDVLVMTFHRQ